MNLNRYRGRGDSLENTKAGRKTGSLGREKK
jgi:hypothetical protein